MKSRWFIVGMLLAAVVAGCSVAPSATPTPEEQIAAGGGMAALQKIPFVDLVREADQIVVGTVVSLESTWNADQTSILTSVRVRVLDVAKGVPDDEVTVVFEGGQVGDVAQSGGEGLSFTEGEQVVLFLRGGSVVGGPQGIFQVVNGKVGEQPLGDFLEQVRAVK